MASELYVNTIAEKTAANGVSVDGVTLKDGGATLTGDFVPATPLSHRNMIINGGMQVWQRATAATAATTTYDTVDRWRLYENTDGAYTSEKHTMALAELNTTGHRTALKLACTIADANIASGQYSYFYTALEGQNCQHMQYGTANAKNITISFWVKSNKTGIYNISIYNDAATNYQVSKNYTISSADTWEQKKITITPTEGSTSLITGSGGLIANDNTQAIMLYFGLAWGSSLSSSAVDTWVAGGTAYGNSSQVNWMDSTSNNFYITGVQLELGSNATPFEHRSYGEELARCHRYYTIIPTQFGQIALGDGSTNGVLMLTVPVPLRHTPAIEQINSVNHRIYKDGYVVSTSNHIGFNSYTADTCFVKATFAGFSSITLGHTYQWFAIGSYKLGINAEL